jgi:hypothetical protein
VCRRCDVSGMLNGSEDNSSLEEQEEEELDPVSEWFMTSEPDAILILHHPACDTSEDERKRCDCTPVTLRRGATA